MNLDSEILKSFSIQNSLNPEIWVEDKLTGKEKMKSVIRDRLLEIANIFSDYLSEDLVISDITMTGSLSNFTWNKYSDIDLHLIVDYNQFPKDQIELYEKMFNLKKTYFNLVHDIKIKGYEVELYAQDESIEHFGTGVYSVLKNEWLIYPKKEKMDFDNEVLLEKVKSWTDKIDNLISSTEKSNDLEKSLKLVDKLKEKLKKYRISGLEEKGEFSYENLVFKFLRRNGYIEKLFNLYNKLQDKNLSLTE